MVISFHVTIGHLNGVEPARYLNGDSLIELSRLPIGIMVVECTAYIQDIHPKAVKAPVFRLSKLLDYIVYSGLSINNTQKLLYIMVGNC